MARTTSKWSKAVDRRRIELLKEGYSYNVVASILTMEFNNRYTKDMVQNRCRMTNTTKTDLGVLDVNPQIEDERKKVAVNVGSLFPIEAYEVDEEVTFTPEKRRRLKELWEQFNDGKPKKILSLSDIHAPFGDFNAIEMAIKAHGDADILVLNGDVFDGNCLSDFDKLNDFDFELELKQVFMLLDVVTKMFETVIWVGGNHDFGRFMKFVARKFGSGMKKYVLKRLNPINYIGEKYDNVIVVPHDWIEIGKAVFAHPSGYSSALMSTALGQEKNLRANKDDILPYPDFQALIMGHTHDVGSYVVNKCLVIEQGCLCYPMDYRFDKPSSRRWHKAYAVVHLDKEGNIDFNTSRWYSCE